MDDETFVKKLIKDLEIKVQMHEAKLNLENVITRGLKTTKNSIQQTIKFSDLALPPVKTTEKPLKY